MHVHFENEYDAGSGRLAGMFSQVGWGVCCIAREPGVHRDSENFMPGTLNRWRRRKKLAQISPCATTGDAYLSMVNEDRGSERLYCGLPRSCCAMPSTRNSC